MSGYGYGYQRRPGFPLRWLLALIIAGIGIFTYFGITQTNPVTGEKQHVAMNAEQEKALGLEAAPRMAEQMGGAASPRSDPDARVVSETGHDIVHASDASRSPYADNFNFWLLNDAQTVNAFALPGGQIFITRALYDRLETEAQVAGVLGHEIGHVINRHAAEHMAKGQLGQMLAVAVGVGASDDRGHGYSAALVAQMVNQMVQLRYSRADELEADRYGLMYMAQAGYDPSAMLRVMQVLKASSGSGRGPSIFQTHPDPDARIEAIDRYLKEKYPGGAAADLREGKRLHEP